MDRETWQAAVQGVTKSQTRLNDFTFTFFSLSWREGDRDGGTRSPWNGRGWRGWTCRGVALGTESESRLFLGETQGNHIEKPERNLSSRWLHGTDEAVSGSPRPTRCRCPGAHPSCLCSGHTSSLRLPFPFLVARTTPLGSFHHKESPTDSSSARSCRPGAPAAGRLWLPQSLASCQHNTHSRHTWVVLRDMEAQLKSRWLASQVFKRTHAFHS